MTSGLLEQELKKDSKDAEKERHLAIKAAQDLLAKEMLIP
jgi:hypothetical protein